MEYISYCFCRHSNKKRGVKIISRPLKNQTYQQDMALAVLVDMPFYYYVLFRYVVLNYVCFRIATFAISTFLGIPFFSSTHSLIGCVLKLVGPLTIIDAIF